jgi:hypothetical protein
MLPKTGSTIYSKNRFSICHKPVFGSIDWFESMDIGLAMALPQIIQI